MPKTKLLYRRCRTNLQVAEQKLISSYVLNRLWLYATWTKQEVQPEMVRTIIRDASNTLMMG